MEKHKQTFKITLEEGEQIVPVSVQWTIDGVEVTGRDDSLTVIAAKEGKKVIGAIGELLGTISGSSVSGNIVSAKAEMILEKGFLSNNEMLNPLNSGTYSLESATFERHKYQKAYLSGVEISSSQYEETIKKLVDYSGKVRNFIWSRALFSLDRREDSF